jgi:preprotein translocase YajC subunit
LAGLFSNFYAAYPDLASFIGLFVIPLGLLAAAIIVPPRQKRKRQEALLTRLKPKDKVITHSGIIGTIEKIEKEKIILRVDERTRIPFVKNAIARKLKDDEEY